MLGVSKLTLRSYIRNGKIRGRKLGVSWYVTEDSIREYFDQSTQIEEPSKKLNVKYIVQGINDLVSETEECDSIDDVLSVLNEQAIIKSFSDTSY